MSAGLELFGPICGTRAGIVAACEIAIELAEVSAPSMQSAPLAISLRAALTPPSGVVASSACSIWIWMSVTPARRSAILACCTASPAAFAYAGPEHGGRARERHDVADPQRVPAPGLAGVRGRGAADQRENSRPR